MARKKNEEIKGTLIEIGSATKKGREITVVSRNIRRYREGLCMEQKEFARLLGVPTSTISNWETGFSKPTLNVIVPVCKVLGITLYELFGLDDPLMKFTAREQLLVSKYHDLTDGHKYAVDQLVDSLGLAEVMDEAPDLTKLIYFDRQLAAGIGDPTDFDDDGEPIFLYSSEIVDTADYVFTVNGDSMEPVYHNDDIVLVKRFPECGDIQPGEVGAFIIGNEAYIKKYQRDGLHSYNEKYDTMKFTDEDKVYFIGKVVGVLDEGDIASESDIEKYTSAHADEDH